MKVLGVLVVLMGVAYGQHETHQVITTTKQIVVPGTTHTYTIRLGSSGTDQQPIQVPVVPIIKIKQPRPSIEQRPVLSSPRVTTWGNWGSWADCPDNSFVVGMNLKTEANQGSGDDSALNAIRLKCSNGVEIRSLEGGWGVVGNQYKCEGNTPATGFQLRSEPNLGSGDDSAANNLRLFCNGAVLEGDGQSWGDWTMPQMCRSGQALCGFRTQVEPDQGWGDDSALNNVDMVCCDL